ncbi:MAG: hypothetical protein QXH47_07890 [Candidatus Bathyarchaeia archaeon]
MDIFLKDKGLFKRSGFLVGLKLKACILYIVGLSYRDIAYVCRFVEANHVSVWK